MTGWTAPGYTETSSLGAGATGRVVAAVEDATGARVAIKYLSAAFLDDEAFLERFRAEAGLLAGLDHPNVVRFHGYVEALGTAGVPDEPGPEPREPESEPLGAALIMELVEGATLRRVLKTSGPVSPEAALSVMRGSLLGLDAAHALGIVHRDYKPSNVLLTNDGVSKLADFGIAEKAGTEMPAIGTPSYMAPEQWEGAPAEPVTDIYAVTASFYECLTGHVPFAADTVFELEELHRTAPIPLADVPPAVRGLVAHGLAKDAGLRPADVSSFIAELEEAAISEYGVEWEEEGRRDLAAFIWPLSSGSAGGGPGGSGPEQGGGAFPAPDDDWFDGMYEGPQAPEAFEEDPGRPSKRVSRGTKAGLAAAAVAVIGSTVAAVAFGSDSTDKVPVAGSTGITLSASSAALSETPSPTIPAGTNAPTPGTPTPTSPTTSSSSSTKPTPTPSKTPSSSSSSLGLPSVPSTSAASTPLTSAPTTPASPTSIPTSSAPTSPSSPSSTPAPGYTITARLATIKSSWSGTCPAPADATQFEVTFSVKGTLPNGSVPITFAWLQNGKPRTRAVTVQAKDGITSEPHNEGGQTSSAEGNVSVTWSSPGGFGGPVGPASYSVTCEVIG